MKTPIIRPGGRPSTMAFRKMCRRQKERSNRVLVIVGNGFDLHHGLPSSYKQFREYAVDKDHDLIYTIEAYIDPVSLWADFEAALAWLDTEKLTDHASQVLLSYGSEDWRDSAHHDYEYEIDKVLSAIGKDLIGYFREWVLQLPIQKDMGDRRVNLLRDARFLTFNYTPTLELVYGITADRIVYIHGKAVPPNPTLILGHAIKPKLKPPLTEYQVELRESADPRVLGGEESLEDYMVGTYKPTEQIIREHESFFNS